MIVLQVVDCVFYAIQFFINDEETTNGLTNILIYLSVCLFQYRDL